MTPKQIKEEIKQIKQNMINKNFLESKIDLIRIKELENMLKQYDEDYKKMFLPSELDMKINKIFGYTCLGLYVLITVVLVLIKHFDT